MASASLVFMEVFTGPDYRQAYPALALVALGSMLGSFAQIAGAGLGIHKKTKLIMINVLIAAGFQTVLNIILVPRFGYMAAAWATPASYALLLVITWAQSRRYMAWIIPWGDLGRIGAASLGMFAVVYAMSRFLPATLYVLIAQVLVGIVLYTGLLFAFGGIRADERRFVGGMASRGFKRLTRGRG
jgi:O-antigen/teichoic acid export membrane protein